jgi:predicted nucleic acid-binding protein
MSADFYDSNLFVYLFDSRSPVKQATAEALVRAGIESGDACISFQVVQETLNVITRKLGTPVKPADAKRLVNSLLMPLCRVMPSAALYTRALDLQGRWSYAFYDSLIIAAALEAGCSRLLSEDLQSGQVIETMRIENPFAA